MRRLPTIYHKLIRLKRAAWNYPLTDTGSSRFARKYASKTARLLRAGVVAMGKEVDETEEMARSFFRMLEAKLNLNTRSDPPSEEEVRSAIEQLKDVGRFSVFGTLVILPGGVISLLGLELLARKFGVKGFNLVPSSFRKQRKAGSPGNASGRSG